MPTRQRKPSPVKAIMKVSHACQTMGPEVTIATTHFDGKMNDITAIATTTQGHVPHGTKMTSTSTNTIADYEESVALAIASLMNTPVPAVAHTKHEPNVAVGEEKEELEVAKK